ncbi:hypothetical protein [Halovulum sp. GXIMD14793]
MYYRQAGQFRTTYGQDARLIPFREDRWILIAILAVAFFVIPNTASNYWLKRFGINLRQKIILKRSDKPIWCTRFDFM